MTAASGAWETARHALGRLFARASVRRLPDERMLPQASVRAAEALTPPASAPGAAEGVWRVSTAVHPSSLSQIDVFVSAEDRRPSAILVEGSHALAPPDCCALSVLNAVSVRVEFAEIVRSADIGRLFDELLTLPPEPLRLKRLPLVSLPKTASAGSLGIPKPKGNALRGLRLPGARLGAARTGEMALSRVPLLRRGLEAPRGVLPAIAFASEQRRLAETARLPLSDVALLGVYPAIPIIAVRRLVVEEEGRLLRLWLKPESWWGRSPPRRITLLVGRQISTGKMLQAAG